MKATVYDLMDAIGGVSDYVVMETSARSRQVKERARIRWGVAAACVCYFAIAVLLSMYKSGLSTIAPPSGMFLPGQGVIGTSDTVDTDTPDTNIPDTDTVDTDSITEPDTEETPQDGDPDDTLVVTSSPGLQVFPVDDDALAEFLLPYQKEHGKYADGMKIGVAVMVETYRGDTSEICLIAHFYTQEIDGEDDGDLYYLVDLDLDSGAYELIGVYGNYFDAAHACGVFPIYQATPAYDYFEFSNTDHYKLYRDKGTADLMLLDKLTGEVTTVHGWSSYSDGAARGFGDGDGGFLLDDKYVFFTLVTPDYDYYGNDYIDEPMPDEGYEEKNYVYVIETGELLEFTDDYKYMWCAGSVLYLYKQSEDGVVYYSVDMSDGINETVREETFFNELSEHFYPESQMTYDGKYYVYVESDNGKNDGGGPHDGTHVFYAYDTETKEVTSAVISGLAEYTFRRGGTVYGEDVYVTTYSSFEKGRFGIAVFKPDEVKNTE